MKMYIKSVPVEDQSKAMAFYTEKLGFLVKHDIPLGTFRWLTLVSSEEPDGVELALEPNEHAATQAFQKALFADGIPITAFSVDSISAEVERLKALGVSFVRDPMNVGTATIAVLDDTCGNLIQLIELHG